MVIACLLAVEKIPTMLKYVLGRLEGREEFPTPDQALFLIMVAVLMAYAQITHLCGTHLWGCFIAGMSFATQQEAHHVWARQVKRVTCWFIRIFFAATLAWAIPVEQLFSLDAFWKGSIMGIGPCILTKVLCAPFMGNARWVIGWAMVGRAEFAYFIAIMAKSLKMLDDSLFAILVWALVYATIFAPLIFRLVLKRFVAQEQAERVKEAVEGDSVEQQAQKNDGTIRTMERQLSDCSSAGSGVRRLETFHLPDEYGDKLEAEKKEKLQKAESVLVALQVAKHELERLRKLANTSCAISL